MPIATMFDLSGSAIHVVPLRLDGSANTIDGFARLLSDDERQRAARFVAEAPRRTFIVARGALRVVLGRALRRDPARITLAYAQAGKPRLADDDAATDAALDFNLAHSGGIAVLAMTRGCALGIDVERHRTWTMPDLDAVAGRHFSIDEVRELAALPDDERIAAFYRCWSRKEAYLKAIGIGLGAPLGDFRVSLLPGAPARLIESAPGRGAASAWSLHDLALADGYAAALAYHAAPRPLRLLPILDASALLG